MVWEQKVAVIVMLTEGMDMGLVSVGGAGKCELMEYKGMYRREYRKLLSGSLFFYCGL